MDFLSMFLKCVSQYFGELRDSFKYGTISYEDELSFYASCTIQYLFSIKKVMLDLVLLYYKQFKN